jgi:hypothetical protein
VAQFLGNFKVSIVSLWSVQALFSPLLTPGTLDIVLAASKTNWMLLVTLFLASTTG